MKHNNGNRYYMTWYTTPQALSLTINPTAAGKLIGLEAGYCE